MTDDLQARLDRAITEAREDVDEYILCRSGHRDGHSDHQEGITALDHYAALVALRARYEAAATWLFGTVQRGRMRELDAECEKLLGR